MFRAPKYTVKGFLKVVKNTKKELLKRQKRQKHCSLRNRKLEKKVNVTLTNATDWTDPSCCVLQKTDWTTSIILKGERVALPGSAFPSMSIPLRSLKSISIDTEEKAALVVVVRGYQFRLKFSSAKTAQKYRGRISGRCKYLRSKKSRQKSASSQVSRKSSLSASEVGPTTDEELEDVSFAEKKKRRRELGKSLSLGSNDDGASEMANSEADRLARRRKRERRDTKDGPATASNK